MLLFKVYRNNLFYLLNLDIFQILQFDLFQIQIFNLNFLLFIFYEQHLLQSYQ